MWLFPSLIACVAPPPPRAPDQPLALLEEDAPPRWPLPGAALRNLPLDIPPGFEPQAVFLSAGHGAHRNEGNLGAWCQREQDFTLHATERLADLLDATGQFSAIRGRPPGLRPSYRSRVAHLARSGATALIELHSDARADAMQVNAVSATGERCWRDDGEPGFTILVRDRGPAPLVAGRLRLARALAQAMAEAGFPPWVGDNYTGLYEADEVPGVWLDRRGLFMLREPDVPSVIIETHNAKDGFETVRWTEDAVHDAFGRAIIAGLVAFYARAPDSG